MCISGSAQCVSLELSVFVFFACHVFRDDGDEESSLDPGLSPKLLFLRHSTTLEGVPRVQGNARERAGDWQKGPGTCDSLNIDRTLRNGQCCGLHAHNITDVSLPDSLACPLSGCPLSFHPLASPQDHLVCAHFPWLSPPPRPKHGKAHSAADIGLQASQRRLCATEQISDEQISPFAEALEAAGPSQCAELKGEATSRYAGSQAHIA